MKRFIRTLLVAGVILALSATSASAAVFSETEPNNTHDTADPASPGDLVGGAISPAGDVDTIAFAVTSGHAYHVGVDGSGAFDVRMLVENNMYDRRIVMDQQCAYGVDGSNPSDCQGEFVATGSGIEYLTIAKGAGGATTGNWSAAVEDLGTVLSVPLPARIGGADRYEVAANVAAAAWSGDWSQIQHVVIASGLDAAMADPLSASALAGAYRAPILLVRRDWPNKLPAATSGTITKIKNANSGHQLHFHIVGGPYTVPESLRAQILAYAPGSSIDRISGADRYAVAANVAAKIRSLKGTGYPKTCFIVNGQNSAYFYDALACGAVAFKQAFPILLVKNSGVVPTVTATARTKYTTRYVVATGAAVPASTAAALGATYVHGGDRTVTTRALSEIALLSSRHWLGYTSGPNYVGRYILTNKLADALSSSVLGGRMDAAILYADSADDPGDQATEYVYRNWYHRISSGWVVGGPASVTENARITIGKAGGNY